MKKLIYQISSIIITIKIIFTNTINIFILIINDILVMDIQKVWSDTSPYTHSYHDVDGDEAHNYCR